MIRTINVNEITKQIKEMCIEANHFLSHDMVCAMENAKNTERRAITGKFGNCGKGNDSDLSGYGNGSYFSGNRTRCSF
mgnify:CR=1 FL=1